MDASNSLDYVVLQTMQKLALNRGTILFNVAVPGGGKDVMATPVQAADVILGKIVPADLLGLSRAEYAEWIALDGLVQCHADTAKGRRCQANVTGGRRYVAAEWKALNDTKPYCHVHGGDSAPLR